MPHPLAEGFSLPYESTIILFSCQAQSQLHLNLVGLSSALFSVNPASMEDNSVKARRSRRADASKD